MKTTVLILKKFTTFGDLTYACLELDEEHCLAKEDGCCEGLPYNIEQKVCNAVSSVSVHIHYSSQKKARSLECLQITMGFINLFLLGPLWLRQRSGLQCIHDSAKYYFFKRSARDKLQYLQTGVNDWVSRWFLLIKM